MVLEMLKWKNDPYVWNKRKKLNKSIVIYVIVCKWIEFLLIYGLQLT